MGRMAASVAAGRGAKVWSFALLLPAFILLIGLYLAPILTIVPEAFTGTGFTQFFASPVYANVAWTTVRIAITVAVVTLLVAYPAAWIISTRTGWQRMVLVVAVIVPFLTSSLVRTFSWLAMLGSNGLISNLLVVLGVNDKPTTLLFTDFAVVIALVHVSLPLMTFSLVAVMRRIPPEVVGVSEALGSSKLRTMLRVVVPQTLPGVTSGLIVVALFAMASFIAPAILGSTQQTMLAQLIQATIETGSNRSFAAALSIVLALCAAALVGAIWLVMWAIRRRRRHTPRAEDEAPNPAALSPVARRSNATATTERVVWKVVYAVYFVSIVVFSLAPMVILVPIAFTSGQVLVFPTPGFSTQWFEAVLSPEWVGAALTSLRIAVAAAVIAVVVAMLTVLATARTRFLARAADQGMLLPMTIPAVVFAIGAYVAFVRLGLVDTELGLTLAQTVLALPVCYLIIAAGYSSSDMRLEDAAVSLGASKVRAIVTVIVPLMLPALAVALLMGVLISFDESVASIFLSGLDTTTLPRKLWSGIRFSTSPEGAAAAVGVLGFGLLMIALTFGLYTLLNRRQRRSSIPLPTAAVVEEQ
ncbi:putative spermidine/putrescine transport system permease protein [Microbacterium sp. BE35]|uniref:ABC transporter permease subunit n=1 Tax=Microbacterium sp. BE35 TaxID=2817773 RepID=UPI002856C3BF|nr:ABC transporter permease subunit [Microbacterium sp. BE35]MDR7188262.1 putative spermidine/putrescine transport system permease protein [Microbacterium sp. BE35]